MDQRRVARKYIDKWIDEHGPNGLLRLAEKSAVSSSTIVQARNGRAPKKRYTQQNIADALGIELDVLFPPAATGGDRAS